MAKTDFKNVDQYLASVPAETKRILTVVRQTIRRAVPGAEEVISYQLPAYKLSGGWVLYFGGFKDHFSLSCPPPFTVFERFKKELAPYVVTKSAIRFPLDRPVPTKLIADIAKFRAEEAAKRADAGPKNPAQQASKPSKAAKVRKKTVTKARSGKKR
jgi:uncharacterized protein YdhG (YjbR/CyaY superfamily)